ncbi:Bcl-2-related protein A1 [Bagarius yarrelli]|uniref:Bcl-2-related protein A1 n=1 Tax=Bagarius yarrelli TaxID=175774 RepID=A0A556VA72_BAGYA|nr:Bcl-2-related protein A1 [Bagarius yarrelli]
MSCWLRKETLVLAEDYIDFCIGIQRTPPSESAQAMRRLAKELELQHMPKFRSLSQRFLSTCGSTPEPSSCLRSVMIMLVEDGKLNWGRIVSLFTFAGVIAVEMFSRGDGVESVRRLSETIADYLGGEKSAWLLENGGWVGTCGNPGGGKYTDVMVPDRSCDADARVSLNSHLPKSDQRAKRILQISLRRADHAGVSGPLSREDSHRKANDE